MYCPLKSQTGSFSQGSDVVGKLTSVVWEFGGLLELNVIGIFGDLVVFGVFVAFGVLEVFLDDDSPEALEFGLEELFGDFVVFGVFVALGFLEVLDEDLLEVL